MDTDAQACSDSTVPPAEQVDAAAPALPEHATDLRYDTARLRPRAGTPAGTTGRTVLRMEFRATSMDIQRWLTANRPYGLRLIVNLDPDSRPRPAVLVTLEEA
ncbi:hypothetical protein ACFVW1_04470 [Streptomyces olivochromogenes]|uniref:hypothetical protein n=1 Tax=Streptomyces olivochromogenes TaxID=1963 RepID=UPI0036DDA5D5